MSTTYRDLPFSSFPDSIQNFTLMQDIISSEGVLVKNFQEAMASGDTQKAQQFYSAITDADAKFLDAKKLNTLFQTCVALQRFYKSDVQSYIEDKQLDWENIIDTFDYKGEYYSSESYVVNNWVSYRDTFTNNNYLYICIKNAPSNHIPTDTEYWRQLTVSGPMGESGPGVSFLGEWNSEQPYTVDDVVTFDNVLYGATQDSQNVKPGTTEGSNYWQVLYENRPTIYPVQSRQPTGLVTGDLWFEVLS